MEPEDLAFWGAGLMLIGMGLILVGVGLYLICTSGCF